MKIPEAVMQPGLLFGKEKFMENRNEAVITSVEQLNDYLKEYGDGGTIISIVLEPAGEQTKKGGGVNGAGV